MQGLSDVLLVVAIVLFAIAAVVTTPFGNRTDGGSWGWLVPAGLAFFAGAFLAA